MACASSQTTSTLCVSFDCRPEKNQISRLSPTKGVFGPTDVRQHASHKAIIECMKVMTEKTPQPAGRTGSSSQAGLTLIELLVAVAVLAVIGFTAVPAIKSMREKQRIVSAVEAVHAQFVRAKSESYKRSQAIEVGVNSGASPWYVGISDQDGCETSSSNCTLRYIDATDGTIQLDTAIFGSDYPDVALSATTDTFSFDPVRKTATNGSVTFETDSYKVLIKTSVVGRLRICSDADDKPLGRYKDDSCN